MDIFRNKKERLEVVLEIAKQLKKYKLPNGSIIDLYDTQYSFVSELKSIFHEYIYQDDNLPLDYSGILRFEEISKDIEYKLPSMKNVNSLFVIRMEQKEI
jgi:hypothetical protein